MKVEKLIEELQKYPQGTEVKIFDWRKNLHHDSGDGSSEGVHDFEINMETYSQDELEFIEDRDGKPYQPWIELTFENEDYDASGRKID